MTDRTSSPNLQQQALQWLALMTSGTVDSKQQAAFLAWLQADENHRHAYDEAEQLWQQIGALVHYPPFQHSLNSYQNKASNKVRRQQPNAYVYGLALAACISFIAIVIPWFNLRWQADYVTGSGENRMLTLADGSTVYLNTQTAIAVDYQKNERQIRLLRGEAEFVVQKDASRPFIVSVGDERIKALGTDFIVRCDREQLTVTMLENKVEVRIPEQTQPMILNPGEQLSHQHGHPFHDKTLVDMQKATAWRRGKLIFESTPLVDVIHEINRYRPGTVMLLGNQHNRLPVSGVFDIQRLDQLLDVMEQTLPVKSARLSDQWVVIY